MKQRHDTLAGSLALTRPSVPATLCGILGPACFIGGWLSVGALSPGYSAIHQAISELARIGAPRRMLMSGAFLAFGLAIPVFGRALSEALEDPWYLRVSVLLAGAATLGVAAFPLSATSGTPEDLAHELFAITGYVATASAPILAASLLLRKHRGRAAAFSIAIGAASAACLSATAISGYTGLFQRLGLTLVDVWFGAMCVWILKETAPSTTDRALLAAA